MLTCFPKSFKPIYVVLSWGIFLVKPGNPPMSCSLKLNVIEKYKPHNLRPWSWQDKKKRKKRERILHLLLYLYSFRVHYVFNLNNVFTFGYTPNSYLQQTKQTLAIKPQCVFIDHTDPDSSQPPTQGFSSWISSSSLLITSWYGPWTSERWIWWYVELQSSRFRPYRYKRV